jgi:NTE family protein
MGDHGVRADRRTARLNLALQGGGAHGAFTWGVLDRLLEEPELDVGWMSGTSAGAVNAVAAAAGLAAGGRSEARVVLKAVWQAVERAGVPDLVRLNPIVATLTRAATVANVGALLSPYDLPGLNPLRDLLATHIPFGALAKAGPDLLVAATDVATGRARIFRRQEITVEHVLASACLPSLHRAVEIDGRAYWDGGFSANPDLVTLASESPVQDTLIVELNPLENPHRPRTAAGIAGRISEITFNQPYLRDLEMIAAAKEARLGLLARGHGSRVSRLKRHRFHLIAAGRYTAELGSASKVRPDGRLLSYLFAAGRDEADRWLATYKTAIGRRATVDIAGRLAGANSDAGASQSPPETG